MVTSSSVGGGLGKSPRPSSSWREEGDRRHDAFNDLPYLIILALMSASPALTEHIIILLTIFITIIIIIITIITITTIIITISVCLFALLLLSEE